MWSLSRSNIRRASAKETDSDPPNESPWLKHERERASDRSSKCPEILNQRVSFSLFPERYVQSLSQKIESISFDRRNYVCSRNEYDRLPKSGYYALGRPRRTRWVQARRRAFKPPISPRMSSSLRCICHMSLLVNGYY